MLSTDSGRRCKSETPKSTPAAKGKAYLERTLASFLFKRKSTPPIKPATLPKKERIKIFSKSLFILSKEKTQDFHPDFSFNTDYFSC